MGRSGAPLGPAPRPQCDCARAGSVAATRCARAAPAPRATRAMTPGARSARRRSRSRRSGRERARGLPRAVRLARGVRRAGRGRRRRDYVAAARGRRRRRRRGRGGGRRRRGARVARLWRRPQARLGAQRSGRTPPGGRAAAVNELLFRTRCFSACSPCWRRRAPRAASLAARSCAVRRRGRDRRRAAARAAPGGQAGASRRRPRRPSTGRLRGATRLARAAAVATATTMRRRGATRARTRSVAAARPAVVDRRRKRRGFGKSWRRRRRGGLSDARAGRPRARATAPRRARVGQDARVAFGEPRRRGAGVGRSPSSALPRDVVKSARPPACFENVLEHPPFVGMHARASQVPVRDARLLARGRARDLRARRLARPAPPLERRFSRRLRLL